MNKKFIILFIVLLAGITVLGTNTYFKTNELKKNGVASTAIIEKISSNKHESDLGMDVDNFHVTYRYIVDEKGYQKTQEILRHEHDFYFTKNGKKGDTINITYHAGNPKHSRIEKLALISD